MNCADQSESKYDTEIEPTRLCIKQIKITEFKVLNSKNHSDSILFFFFLFLSAGKFQKKNIKVIEKLGTTSQKVCCTELNIQDTNA